MDKSNAAAWVFLKIPRGVVCLFVVIAALAATGCGDDMGSSGFSDAGTSGGGGPGGGGGVVTDGGSCTPDCRWKVCGETNNCGGHCTACPNPGEVCNLATFKCSMVVSDGGMAADSGGVSDSGTSKDAGSTGNDAGTADVGSQPDSGALDAGNDAGPVDTGMDAGDDGGQCRVSAERNVYYMSADDSNSKASAVIVRRMITQGRSVYASDVRTYEFLNYYRVQYTPPAELDGVNVVPQMSADPDEKGNYVFQVGVQAPRMLAADRRPLNLTFSLDTTGSMEGNPLAYEKEVVKAIASELRAGDIVSIVRWNTSQYVLLDSHPVSGPNDAQILQVVDGLYADGSTDLDSGVIKAYEIAMNNYNVEYMNRVIVISDGQANVGVTSAELIAQNAEDKDREGIYLVGVGTGDGYDDLIMDTLTDKGKGAYLFVDGRDEAWKQFTGEKLIANLEVAAKDVRLKVDLPPGFKVVEFHGEQISTDPAKVRPQYLSPNSAMVFHSIIGTCPGAPFPEAETFIATAEYTKRTNNQRTEQTVTLTGAQLLRNGDGTPWPELLKGNAVVAYAEALKEIGSGYGPTQQVCLATFAVIDNASATLPNDKDLVEIKTLLGKVCGR